MKRRRHIADEPSRHDPWQSAKTYADLIRANCAFLRGELSSTPYHLGPIDPETVPLVSNLLALHSYGILTYCGQPARREIGGCKDERGKETQEFFEIDQKPSVDFIVQKHVASDHLVDVLLSQNDYVSTFVVDSTTKKRRTNVTLDTPDAFDKGFGIRYCVTKERVAKDQSKLASAKWKPFTHIGFTEIADNFARWPNILRALQDTYSVSISGRSSAGGDVEQMLIQMCAELDFPRFQI